MSSYSDLVRSLAPVAYWRLGEAAGTVAADLTGRYPGTYVGSPALGVTGALSGDPNTAAALTGGTYVEVGDAAPFDAAGVAPFSVVCWVNHTPDATYRRIVSKESAGNVGWVIYSQSGALGFLRGAGGADQTSSTALTAGWHQVVATYTGTLMAVYVDGVLSTGSSPTRASTRSLADSAVPLRIGTAAYSVTASFNGNVDEVAYFDRALTDVEIARLYATGTGQITGYSAIAQALALRFDAAQMTAPTGYDPVRLSTYQPAEDLPPLPCVLVFAPTEITFTSGNGTRHQGQDWTVRLYYDQAGDLARQAAALLAWLGVFVDQLRDSVQLGGLVTSAVLTRAKSGYLTYAGADYAGIEGTVRITTDEGWSATA